MTSFRPIEKCWRVAQASTCIILIDAENYFRAVRAAIKRSQERIGLIGWDFNTRVNMYDSVGDLEEPLEIGAYIDWLVARNPQLEVFLLHWNIGALKILRQGKTLLTLLH